MTLNSFKDLNAWKKGMELVVEIYRCSRKLPRGEQYGLSIQLQRAAVSIPANIAEGYGRLHRGEYVHHLSIANGSLTELETLLEIALALNYLGQEDIRKAKTILDEEGKLLYRLVKSLREILPHPPP